MPTPAQTATDPLLIPVRAEDLPLVGPTNDEVRGAFPGATVDHAGGEFQDNRAAAQQTLDPDDTATDLASQGRLNGYVLGFSRGEELGGGASVDLFDGPLSARTFLDRQVADYLGLVGRQIGDPIVREFHELEGPGIATGEIAGALVLIFPGLELEVRVTFVGWTRGSLVAQVIVATPGVLVPIETVGNLALAMDRRIEAVLAGEVPQTMPPPTPPTVPTPATADMAGMVLSVTDVAAEFPRMGVDRQEAGPVDNAAAVEDTIDPTDTPDDLESRGRIFGYESSFSDFTVLFAEDPEVVRPLVLRAAVELYNGADSAGEFVEREMADYRRLAGSEAGRGFALKGFEALPPPGFRDAGAAARVRASLILDIIDADVTAILVAWTRGPLVATLLVVGLDDADLVDPTLRLAHAMDQRIGALLSS